MIIDALGVYKKEFFLKLSDNYKDNVAWLIAHFPSSGPKSQFMDFIEGEGPFSDHSIATRRLIELSRTSKLNLQLVPVVPVSFKM